MKLFFISLMLLSPMAVFGNLEKMPNEPMVVEYKVGDEIIISEPANGSTGYIWELDPSYKSFMKLENKTYTVDCDSIGSSGMQHWIFKALKPGAHFLNLSYKRSWENSPIQTKSYFISIVANDQIKLSVHQTKIITLRSQLYNDEWYLKTKLSENDCVKLTKHQMDKVMGPHQSYFYFNGVKPGTIDLCFTRTDNKSIFEEYWVTFEVE
jgi:predicted secreted protein